MDPAQTNQQPINWQAISAAIAQGIIPAPAGSNENGEPYWVINDQKVTWYQVQGFVANAQKEAETSGQSGGGIESIPSIPNIPAMPNFEAQETRVEQGVERGPKSPEKQPQQQSEQSQVSTKAAVQSDQSPKKKGPSFVGQSAPLKKVDTSDPNSMLKFVQENKSEPSDSSNKFLAEFLEKILQVLSIDVK